MMWQWALPTFYALFLFYFIFFVIPNVLVLLVVYFLVV